jgi:hypothetical protein
MWPRRANRTIVVALCAAGLLACGLTQAGCDGKKKKDPARERREAAAHVEGLAALPAEARVVVGANVAQLRDSALVRRAFRQMLSRDPGLGARLEALQARCKLEPDKDLDSVVVGLSGTTAARDVVLVAKGRFDEAAIEGCVRSSLEEKGGSLEKKQQGGMTLYVAHGTASGGDVAFTFGAPGTLILADSEALLVKARDPAAKKVKDDGAMMQLIGQTDVRAGLWGAGQVAPEVGKGLVDAAGVKAPATAIWGHLALDKGLAAELAVEMTSDADAKTLLEVFQKQVAQYAVVAQVYALGPAVSKIRSETRGKVFVVTLVLAPEELAYVEKVLSGAGAKEGATP